MHLALDHLIVGDNKKIAKKNSTNTVMQQIVNSKSEKLVALAVLKNDIFILIAVKDICLAKMLK